MRTWHSEMSAMCKMLLLGFRRIRAKMRCVPEHFLFFFHNELEFRAYIKYNISTKSW